MTLILAVKCKNGICVCADKKNVTVFNNRNESFIQDNTNKIYKFKKIPLIIYNHGVNEFNKKSGINIMKNLNKRSYWTLLGLMKYVKISENL